MSSHPVNNPSTVRSRVERLESLRPQRLRPQDEARTEEKIEETRKEVHVRLQHRGEQRHNNETRLAREQREAERTASRPTTYLTKGEQDHLNDTSTRAYNVEKEQKQQKEYGNRTRTIANEAKAVANGTAEEVKKLQAEVLSLKTQIKEKDEHNETAIASLTASNKEKDKKFDALWVEVKKIKTNMTVHKATPSSHDAVAEVYNKLSSHDGVADFKDPTWNKKRKWEEAGELDKGRLDDGRFDDADTPKAPKSKIARP